MIPDYLIVEARPWNVGQILRRMRKEHREGVVAAGVDAHRELRMIFEASSFRRACLLDGKLMALWGMTGTLAESTGYAWAVLAEDATRYRRAILHEGRRQVRAMMRQRRELETTVLEDDVAGRRFALKLGFQAARGETRLSVGDTSVIPMVYH